jgi:tetratricopeptide (TPR) repeat protein
MKNDKSKQRRKSQNGKSHHNSIIDLCINRISNNSGDFMAYFNLAHELKTQGEVNKALKYYDKGLKIFPKNISALINRALIYIFLCDFTKAIADLCKAIVNDPFQPKAYIYRAIAYWGAGRKSEAIDDFNKVNQFFPEFTGLFTAFDYTTDPLPGFKEALEDCLTTEAIFSMAGLA